MDEQVSFVGVERTPAFTTQEVAQLSAIIAEQLPRWGYTKAYVLYCSHLNFFEPPLGACAIRVYDLPVTSSTTTSITLNLSRGKGKAIQQEIVLLRPRSALAEGEVLKIQDSTIAVAVNHCVYIALDLFDPAIETAITAAILKGILRRIARIPITVLEVTRENLEHQIDAISDALTASLSGYKWKSARELEQVAGLGRKTFLPKQWQSLVSMALDISALEKKLEEKILSDAVRLVEHPEVESLQSKPRGTLKICTHPIYVKYQDLYYMFGRYEICINDWILTSVQSLDNFRTTDSAGLVHPRVLNGRLWLGSSWQLLEEALTRYELFLAVSLILEALKTIDEEVFATPDLFWQGLPKEEFMERFPHINLDEGG